MTAAGRFAAQASTYDRNRGGEERARHTADEVAPHLVLGSLLDVGVGTGSVAAALRDRGWQVDGVDAAEPMVEAARERLGADHVHLADASALPFPGGTWDNVVCLHVLHLVDDLPAAVVECARMLRPGGRLVVHHGHPVAVGDRDDLAVATAALEPLQQDRPDTEAGLAAAATAAGLRVVVQELTEPMPLEMSPSWLASNIESRTFPYLFGLDDETWQGVVEPSIAALRELPDQDRQRPNHWSGHRSVFEA